MQELYRTKSHLFAASVTSLAFSKFATEYNFCNQCVIVYYNKEFTFYLDDESAQQKTQLASNFFSIESNFKLYLQQCKNIEAEYETFYNSLEKDYSSYSNQALASVFNSLLMLQAKCASLYQGTHEDATIYFHKQLELELSNKGVHKNEIISLLSTENSKLLQNEENDFVELQKSTNPNYVEFIRKHPWVCAKSFYLDDAILELKALLNTRTPRQNSNQNQVKSTLFINEKVEVLVSKLQMLGELRFELKRLLGFKILGNEIYAEISKRMNMPKSELFYNYDAFDVINFLQNNQIPPKCNGTRYYSAFNSKIQVLSDAEASMQASLLEPKFKTEKITGMPTFLGKATGKVRIVLSSTLLDLTNVKFEQGDVLVTSMTNPNMLFLAAKASAIVTDEGGVTCHAAIISRELKVPCIVGTKIATKALKDGELVEVDATQGIVKKL